MDSAETSSNLAEAIAAYLESVARGEPLDRERLLQANADCREELTQFFTDHDAMTQAARPWAEALERDERGDRPTLAWLPGGDPNSSPLASLQEPSPALPAGAALPLSSARFGDYQLLEEIARGGMGVVYRARQLSLNRIVAVKMILHGRLSHSQDQGRFRLEAEAAAKLRHPHIVVVYECGKSDDQHFFSMEYIEGQSLAELARADPIAPTQAAQWVRQVAEAVHFAHQNGVLHRDIKPSNVLVDPAGTARVTDFGLAKRIDQQQDLTLTGQLVGTPKYMAPEQISRAAGPVGPACDVYGLGALLYELLTGAPPFRGSNQVETLLAVLEADPPLPRQLRPGVPRELEMIALRCLEKNPNDRYPTAQAVADDLERYIQGDSLSISSPHILNRIVRALERSRFDREVHAASKLVMHSAWIAAATHVGVFLNYVVQAAHPLATLVGLRLAEIAAMLAVAWPRRKEWFPPRGAAARQLWSIWIAYLAGSLTLLAIDYSFSPPGQPYFGLRAYPSMAVLASLTFWLLGSTYWGYCYLIGGLFLIVGAGMPFFLPIAPLIFGVGWGVSLALLGRRLKGLTAERDRES